MPNVMRPLPFVWPYALAFWAVCVWVYAPEFRIVRRANRDQRGKARETRDPSLRPLLLGQQFVVAIAVLLAFRATAFTIGPARVAVFVIGILVAIGGSLLRRHCFRMLGGDFRGDVTVRTGQEVIQRGAYRYVRHPSYSAAMLLHLGFGLSLGNWLSLVVLVAGILPLYVYRMRVEERALVSQLGPAYAEYMARTNRLVPGVW